VSPVTPKVEAGGEDFFAWQGRQESRQGSRHRGEPPTVHPAPLPRSGDQIDVKEHRASTTIVEQIRGALLKRLRGE
jgi:hypothetical protein